MRALRTLIRLVVCMILNMQPVVFFGEEFSWALRTFIVYGYVATVIVFTDLLFCGGNTRATKTTVRGFSVIGKVISGKDIRLVKWKRGRCGER